MAELRLGTLNSVFLIGRAVADPDLRYTPKGTPVLSFRIAVGRRYKDPASDEWKEETSYFTVNCWTQLAERLSERLRKGMAVLVQGELRSRSWETPTGEKRTAVEIYGRSVQILDKTAAPGGSDASPEPQPPADETDTPRDQLDDIPF
ncbi:MAG: single-stranded DNA-binding protein [candidate division WOR-3 bacterium]